MSTSGAVRGRERIHLVSGNDVIALQFVADPTYLDRLAELADAL